MVGYFALIGPCSCYRHFISVLPTEFKTQQAAAVSAQEFEEFMAQVDDAESFLKNNIAQGILDANTGRYRTFYKLIP